MKDKVKNPFLIKSEHGKETSMLQIILVTKKMILAVLFFAVRVIFIVSIQLA